MCSKQNWLLNNFIVICANIHRLSVRTIVRFTVKDPCCQHDCCAFKIIKCLLLDITGSIIGIIILILDKIFFHYQAENVSI